MTLQVSQSITAPASGVLTTPTALTPAATDTFAESSFGPTGLILAVVTTGTLTNLTVLDPGLTPLGDAATVPSLAGTATGTRYLFVPRAAINPATNLASITFSGALTGVTYSAFRA
jgi:hypothetical protein